MQYLCSTKTKKRHPSRGQRLTIVLLLFSTPYDNNNCFRFEIYLPHDGDNSNCLRLEIYLPHDGDNSCCLRLEVLPHDGDNSNCLRHEVLPLPLGGSWRGYDSSNIHPPL